jgi:predicted RNA-binding Zn-ribbon protein involved in translation (DUF1610 family)
MNQAVICPACGSAKTMRIERSFFEKLMAFLGSSKAPQKKYQCTACLHIISLGQAGEQSPH